MENKEKKKKLSKYLFQGDWVEQDGVKWAFFSSDTGPLTTDYYIEEMIAKQEMEEAEMRRIEERLNTPAVETVSITDMGKQLGGNRYGSQEKRIKTNILEPPLLHMEPSSPLPSQGFLEPDTVLSGRYVILERYKSLEKRDFYMASDERLEIPCIVKELQHEFNSEAEKEYYRKRFKEEAKLLAELDHPNLPKVRDYFMENKRYFMVIDYIKGMDLETLLKNKQAKFSEIQVIKWAIDICDVLSYLHSNDPPVIHRDITPANLFVKERNLSILLFNFNVARRLDKSCTKEIGTMGYAPPEQMSGNPEQRSDIYSLGATLHHILTGKPPVPLRFKPVRTLNENISKSTEMIIQKALNVNINERYKSAYEMKNAFINALERITKNNDLQFTPIPLLKSQFEELVDMLKEKSVKRLKAINELGKLGDKRAIEVLAPILEDKSPGIRLQTLAAIGMLNDNTAIPIVAKLLNDDNCEVRKKATEIIEKLLGDKKFLMFLPKDSKRYPQGEGNQ